MPIDTDRVQEIREEIQDRREIDEMAEECIEIHDEDNDEPNYDRMDDLIFMSVSNSSLYREYNQTDEAVEAIETEVYWTVNRKY